MNKKIKNISSKDLNIVTGGAGWWQESASKLWNSAASTSTTKATAWNWGKSWSGQ